MTEELCGRKVESMIYSPSVLTGRWLDEKESPAFLVSNSNPIPWNNIDGYRSITKIDFGPPEGYHELSLCDKKLQYLTELPFISSGPNVTYEFSQAANWISEMKDNYRDPWMKKIE